MTPYAASLLPILQHYLTASHAELLPCRCHATECAGLVLEGLGAAAQAGSAEARALLAASVPGFMQQALQVSALLTIDKISNFQGVGRSVGSSLKRHPYLSCQA